MTANCPQCQRRMICPSLYQHQQQEAPFDCDRFLLDPLTCTVIPNDSDCAFCPVVHDCERQRRTK